MDINQLEDLKQKAEAEYNELVKQGESHRQEVNKIETRLSELRGEFQSYLKLIEEFPAVKVKGEGKKNG